MSGGFEFPRDKYTFSKKWHLRRFSGEHSLDVSCPAENSVVRDVSHLEGVGLSIVVVPCINGVQRCDLAILVAEGACAAAAWETENGFPVSRFTLGLVQLSKEVIVSIG